MTVLVKGNSGGVTDETSYALDVSGTARVPFGRLVVVEARKMTDTLAGFWLLLITGLLLVLAMGITLLVIGLNDDLTLTSETFSGIMGVPVSLLLPVFAILTVTSEWGQRTGLVTFTQEPHRVRVIMAKLVTVMLLALATISVAIGLGAVGNVAGAAIGGYDATWDLGLGTLGWIVLQQLLYFVMAFAFGLLLLSTPGSIAVYYIVALLLPLMVYGALYALFGWARDLIPWVDIQYAMQPLVSGTDNLGRPLDVETMDYVRTAFTAFLWVVVPSALGFWRVLRAEVK